MLPKTNLTDKLLTMEKPQSFLSIPNAIIVGAVIIAVAILISGGVIKIGSKGSAIGTNAPAASPVAQQPQQPTQPTVTLAQVKDAFNKAQIKFGDTNKKLVIIEAADPSCPYCSIAVGENPELNKQAGDRFKLVADGGTYVAPVPEIEKLVKDGSAAFAWVYTPGHGAGEMGTKAMYCAFEKGKFWEVHDLLMGAKGYDLLNNTIKNDKAKSGELAEFLAPVFDSATMKACLDSGKFDSRLQTDIALASGIGISGTPGFYLNTTNFSGAYNYTDMAATVKTALGI